MERKKAPIQGLTEFVYLSMHDAWMEKLASRMEVTPMSFSLQEVMMLGMFLLALLAYLKRK